MITVPVYSCALPVRKIYLQMNAETETVHDLRRKIVEHDAYIHLPASIHESLYLVVGPTKIQKEDYEQSRKLSELGFCPENNTSVSVLVPKHPEVDIQVVCNQLGMLWDIRLDPYNTVQCLKHKVLDLMHAPASAYEHSYLIFKQDLDRRVMQNTQLLAHYGLHGGGGTEPYQISLHYKEWE